MYTDLHWILKCKEYKDCIQYSYFQKDLNNKRKKKQKKDDTEESQRCSLSRTSSLLKEYILNNDFKYFFTLTIKYDFRNNVKYTTDLINKYIKNYSKQCKTRGIQFSYVYVYEKQKKGGIHLHGFFNRVL